MLQLEPHDLDSPSLVCLPTPSPHLICIFISFSRRERRLPILASPIALSAVLAGSNPLRQCVSSLLAFITPTNGQTQREHERRCTPNRELAGFQWQKQ